MFLVDEQFASPREEVFQGDARQGRPMVRCPSVPMRLFMHFSSINRTFVLLPRPFPLNTCSSLIPDWYVLSVRVTPSWASSVRLLMHN
jgi:hypothetical protein